jgi:hypothetical protein
MNQQINQKLELHLTVNHTIQLNHSEKIKDSYRLIGNITLNLASHQLDQSKDSYLCLGTP